ncbi:KpsF/GutQ family sugar-phosphate isomerase [Hasllibacter halocynthiae]|nr:KpsF/GutQ family sugar-phosphate isomerase [Hasllibacter halocynthiae]
MQEAEAAVARVLGEYETALGGLRAAVPALAPALSRARALILAMKGRLVVAGMGKSGHVGRKLAATFASTGTPAIFVHPAEASHGDLGMVAADDVLLMLSWSGETRELSDLIGHAKRYRIPIVSLTGAKGATLARRSDVALVLPMEREACPMELAPTTSTLLQLAMGDALAIAVLEARGFGPEDFRGFHPGGKLGAALLPVSEVMHAGDRLPLVDARTSVLETVAEVGRKGFGIVGVTEGGRLAGVVTDGDLRRYLEANVGGTMAEVMQGRTAGEIMTPGGITIEPDRLAMTALATLRERRIGAAFVTEGGRPVGLVTLLQLLGVGVA